MRIKICGITNKEDALNAVSLGADAIGFIFYENSPRYIHPDAVEEIMMFLPPFVSTVGVFVNHSRDYINQVVNQCRLNVIQLHGEEAPKDCQGYKQRVIKAIRVFGPEDLQNIHNYQGVVSGVLLDTKVEGVQGGTGKTFDWGLALKAKENDVPLILSGGINAENVRKAVKLVNPYGMDLCSGVEREPGLKDYNKMQDLIGVARSV
ncbi:phosphoribosylanthranilate isomerase [bacterium]|jgi:phosphoribosylanthranilate isomerase|nr:phosphoribosylanthranilate isomerase [bacterium]